MNAEQQRLEDQRLGKAHWRKWGPYLSERQWGTVREDYSADGNSWNSFPHDHARSRVFRWGEDGLAGFCDEKQNLCAGIALWNGHDPILKERLFGLTNGEGNHGEDVKEIYAYLDATPSHSYLKMLYKYPQAAYPYHRLVIENGRRGQDVPEFELMDTGIFKENRYFDIIVEYAKAGPDDWVMKVTAHNRGPAAAEIWLLPQIWFRNTWSWKPKSVKPLIRRSGGNRLSLEHTVWKNAAIDFNGEPTLLFCENETNLRRHEGKSNAPGFFKDAFHEYVLHGTTNTVNSAERGTKAGALYHFTVPAGGSVSAGVRFARTEAALEQIDLNDVLAQRQQEADIFYADLQHDLESADARLVQRQAFAGLIWSKQFYYYDIPEWLHGDPLRPRPPAERLRGRNHDWLHLNNADVISMPDKWEYPWYASWDLAFHMIPFALIDAEFAKSQLLLLTREWFMHPNGQFPAYEFNFGDVNPPVQAWAAWRVYQIDCKQHGKGDLEFLERVFHKYMINFTWWVNRKDAQGRNVFQGGFLGLDNIGVFDRSAPLPTGGHINQADGTAWMAMYCLNLMRIALELALHNRVYEDVASKFFEHFLHIAEAMTNVGCDPETGVCQLTGVGLWDPEDKFFYDKLILPNGEMQDLKVRSMVGLIPLFAVETIEPEMLDRLPDFKRRMEWFLNYRPDLAALVSHWHEPGAGDRRLLSLLRGHRMKKILLRMLDETEFLSDYGVRSLSRFHRENPYKFIHENHHVTVAYEPADSSSRQFGGNSNWRGPVWFPVNYLIIESLQRFHHYYGDDFRVECPTGSGTMLTLEEIAGELSHRLTKLFLLDEQGRRPLYGNNEKLQSDPNFRDCLPFPEFFDGDTGKQLGAAHQTGWTALIAKLLHFRRPEGG